MPKDLEKEMKSLIKRTDNFIDIGIKARQKIEKELRSLSEEITLIKKELIFERNNIEKIDTKYIEKMFSEMNETMTDFLRSGADLRVWLTNSIKNIESRVKNIEDTAALRGDIQNILYRVQNLEEKMNRGNLGRIIEKIDEIERKIVLMRSSTPYVIE